MSKKKLFVCEKPMAAKLISSIMSDDDIAILAQGTAAYQFNYQEISFKESPYTREIPKYKKNNNYEFFDIVTFDNKGNSFECPTLKEIRNLDQYSEIIKEYFAQFSEVIYCCDYDLTGYRAFSFRMEFYFKIGDNWEDFFEKNNIKLSVIKINAFDSEMLKESYKERLLIKGNVELESLKSNYIKKDYFEYNYNLNSMLFFGQALREVGYIKGDHDFLLTKNYIWVIFELNKNKLNLSTLLKKMENKNIASSASRKQLLKNLKLMGLIKEDNSFSNKCLELSQLSLDFIKKLHKKVDDPFISLRLLHNNFEYGYNISGLKIKNVENLSILDFMEKYEKYLYNTFSKQKRFLRK